jgi:hypothetical protein
MMTDKTYGKEYRTQYRFLFFSVVRDNKDNYIDFYLFSSYLGTKHDNGQFIIRVMDKKLFVKMQDTDGTFFYFWQDYWSKTKEESDNDQ